VTAFRRLTLAPRQHRPAGCRLQRYASHLGIAIASEVRQPRKGGDVHVIPFLNRPSLHPEPNETAVRPRFKHGDLVRCLICELPTRDIIRLELQT